MGVGGAAEVLLVRVPLERVARPIVSAKTPGVNPGGIIAGTPGGGTGGWGGGTLTVRGAWTFCPGTEIVAIGEHWCSLI